MKRQPAFSRTLFLSFAAISLAFACSTLAAIAFSYEIEARTETLMGNALPSIDRLTAACDALRDLEAASADYPEMPVEQQRAARAAMNRRWQDVDVELTTYLSLPAFPGELELYMSGVPAALRDVSRVLDGLFAQVEAHEQVTADEEVRTAVDRAAVLLRDLVRFNTAHAREEVHRIARVHQAASRNALVLAALALLSGIAVTLWVSRQFGAHDRLLKDHATIVERRADELELFANRVAHDLLSPLSALTFCLGAFKRVSEADPKLRHAMTRAGLCVLRAQRMVDGLFEFARSGGRPQSGRADVRDVVEQVREEVQSAESEERPDVTIEPFEPCLVACNPGVLSSILTNLMRNAAKYMSDSAMKRITVRVREKGSSVLVEVEDTGPGIPEGMEKRIFEPYVRAEGVTQAGLGLGLATVKRLCDAYGGAVGVRSMPAQGSVFWFRLPKLAHGESVPPVSAVTAVRQG